MSNVTKAVQIYVSSKLVLYKNYVRMILQSHTFPSRSLLLYTTILNDVCMFKLIHVHKIVLSI